MGHVHVDARIRATRAAQAVRFLVDTGASYALLPQALADGIGVLALPPVAVSLANGAQVAYPVGTFILELLGREAPVTTFIVPDGDDVEPLLGVEALEGLGLAVDPSSGQLRPTRARAVLLVSVRSGRAPRSRRRRARPKGRAR